MSNEVQKTETTAAPAVPAPKNITDVVLGKVNGMMSRQELFMPANYSPENALKSAWLKLQSVEDRNKNKALDVCTTPSICNALLDMVVQGLSPAKNQCYFVPYGNELTLMRSYMGTVAVAKRFSNVKDVRAEVIYEADDFEYEIDHTTGLKKIIKHKTSFKNIDITKIIGAYAVVTREGEENYVEVMTMQQIRTAWGQGATKGNSPAHKNFTEEMAKKTVINRACKMFINTSDDSPVLTEAFNRTTETDYRSEDRTYYDTASDVIVDVADEDITSQAAEAVFGKVEATPFDDPDEMEQQAAEAEIIAEQQELEAGDIDDLDQR